MPWTWIGDVVKRLAKLISPTDYYSLLVFHVGINDTARGVLESSKQALGMTVKGTWAQVGFDLILLVSGRVVRRSGWILLVNSWLHSCHWQKGLDFYEHGTLSED